MSLPPVPGARVLVVDDEPGPRRAAARLLRVKLGLEVREAAGAIEALTAWRREGPFDAAVIDLDMPEMDGVELLARFAKLAPDLPVVVWTGRPLEKMVGQLTHARYVIAKSADHSSLVQAVAVCLGAIEATVSRSGPAPRKGADPSDAKKKTNGS